LDKIKKPGIISPDAEPLELPAKQQIEALSAELARAGKELSKLRRDLNDKQKELDEAREQLSKTQMLLIQKETQLNRILNTLGWRLLSRYGRVKYGVLLPAIAAMKKLVNRGLQDKTDPYEQWARRSEQLRYDPERAARNIEKFNYRPVISIVMPVYNPPEQFLRKAIESVINQYYPLWQLSICDDHSSANFVRQLLEEYSSKDDRINVVFSDKNSGIVAASNLALRQATGEFIGLLDHDDELTPDALYEVVRTLQEVEADLLYSDEDKLDQEGKRCDAFFKPAWSPDLLMSCNYISHFGVYRREVVEGVGGFREGMDGSQDYDLVLRVTERTGKIVHIPKVLYHWRKLPTSAAASGEAKPRAYDAAKRALNEALTRRGIEGEVADVMAHGFYKIRRAIVNPGKVTIIIPTRDGLELLRRCVDSIDANTDYKNYEIIIIDNGSEDEATLKYLGRTPHRVIRDDGPFNFSRLNNLAASEADGEYLLLLNNDVEVISSEWLRAMVEQAQRPEVGAVGAKLLYPNDQIQHAGTVLGIGGVASHSHKFVHGFKDNGYFNFPNVIRNYSAVTAACMMIRRELYNEMGGLNEYDLAIGFNDVDFCLRLRKRGYLIVYTPYALLYHHESATRGSAVNEQEISYMLTKWHDEITNDPYYNPNLSLLNESFQVDFAKPESLYRIYAQDSSNEATGQIVEGKTIGQAFYASQNNLCAISIRFATYDYKCRGRLRVHVRHSPQSDRDIALVEIDALSIEDNEFLLCSFDPIPDSGGRNLYFYVEFVNQSSDSRLSVWKTSTTNNEVGPYFEDHQPMQGTLSFRLYSASQFRKLAPPLR
jgi:O-antigen biosynthesis protein